MVRPSENIDATRNGMKERNYAEPKKAIEVCAIFGTIQGTGVC
jgi:hypothetical protein